MRVELPEDGGLRRQHLILRNTVDSSRCMAIQGECLHCEVMKWLKNSEECKRCRHSAS